MRKLRLLTGGESHGPGLTAILEGLPAGLEVDREQIDGWLKRRQHGFGRGGGVHGRDVRGAADAILRIAIAKMSLAVREVSVEKGYDPRDFALVASGGAGPLHAVAIARELHIPTVIVPRFPAHFSALGMLMAGALYDLAASAGIEEIVVKMMSSQTAAIRIFRKLGFRREAVLRNYVKDMKGTRKDLVLMRCRLDDLWQKYEDFVHESDLRSFRMV